MFEVMRGDPREVVIRVSGGFDESAGVQLAHCIEQLPKAKRVVVDFSRLSSFHDSDVGLVARGLAGLSDVCRRGLSVLSIRGLGRHHLRLLRYCGVSVPSARELDQD